MGALKRLFDFARQKGLLLAVVPAVILFYAGGFIMGQWLGQMKPGLSMRLECRFGPANVTGVFCEQNGAELHVTSNLTFVPEESEDFLKRSRFYEDACFAVRGVLLSDPIYDGIRSMRLTFLHGGKTTATIVSYRYRTGDIEPFCMFSSEKPGANFFMILD